MQPKGKKGIKNRTSAAEGSTSQLWGDRSSTVNIKGKIIFWDSFPFVLSERRKRWFVCSSEGSELTVCESNVRVMVSHSHLSLVTLLLLCVSSCRCSFLVKPTHFLGFGIGSRENGFQLKLNSRLFSWRCEAVWRALLVQFLKLPWRDTRNTSLRVLSGT